VPLSEATKKVNDSLNNQRDRFVEVAQKMGLTADQAHALADKYGLIPKDISTDVTANVKQAQAAIDALPVYAKGVTGTIVLSANADPATGKINTTVQYADGSIGVVTIDGNKNPATGKIETVVRYADGSLGVITVDAANAAAKAGTLEAVRFADGSVGYIQVKADGSAAQNTLNELTRPRTVQITYTSKNGGMAGSFNAEGNYYPAGVGFADGGFPIPEQNNNLGALAQVIPPGVLKWAGDARGVDELFVPLNGSARSKALLSMGAQHEGMLKPVPSQQPAPVAQVGGQPIIINITPPPDMDYEQIARVVSREINLRGH
jgi:hypothetical protein